MYAPLGTRLCGSGPGQAGEVFTVLRSAGWKVGLKGIPLPRAATVLVGIVFPH